MSAHEHGSGVSRRHRALAVAAVAAWGLTVGAPVVAQGDQRVEAVATNEPSTLALADVDGRLGRREWLAGAQLAELPFALTALADLDLAADGFIRPLEGRLSSAFGWRNIAVNGNRYHAGVDLVAAAGTPVAAARDGLVTRSGWWGTYGYVVVLDHGDGSETRYAHLSRLGVAVGDAVRQGDVVGAVGSTGASTGPHLHFELRFAGRAVDPLSYLPGPR